MLERLTLTQFRNYRALTWEPGARIAVITGPNGSGKTNLLEAVSLLAPGRGLRGSRVGDLPRRDPQGTVAGQWAVAARVRARGEGRELATGAAPAGPPDRRVFRLDGAAPRTQAEIAALFCCVWITPQMDRLFQEGASARRRFLDRLTWALDPAHAREVAAHDAALAGRNRLLAQGRADPAWLAALEDSIARHAVAVAAARRGLVARLNAAIAGGAAAPFPAARLVLADVLADALDLAPALSVEERLRDALAAGREEDARAGTAGQGAHRADLRMEDAASGLSAALASTGQQKALLLGTVLGHAALIGAARGAMPVLLLDEPAVHLDATRREALWAALGPLGAQVLLTGTDPEPFAGLRGGAEFMTLGAP